MKISDIKMIIGVMRNVKNFDDSADVELIGGFPQAGSLSTGVVVRFRDGDINVTLESDISRLLGRDRG